jgi:hypothetical protein
MPNRTLPTIKSWRWPFLPPEGHLDNLVQGTERRLGRYQQATPDLRLDVAQPDPKLEHVAHLGQTEFHAAEDSESGTRIRAHGGRARRSRGPIIEDRARAP